MTGPELRHARETLLLTRRQLAALIPVHWNTLNKWERGERTMHPVFVARVQAILDKCRKEHAWVGKSRPE